jgi:putative ABC transport system substrate-binding protein
VEIVEAQQAGKVYDIGYLANSAGIESREEAFRQGLRELGYIEGQNIGIEWRFSKGKLDRLPDLAAQLVRLKVDLIIAVGVNPTRAAKQATSTIPIVMGNADDDPVRHGLVASLARPGGNVTGFTNIGSDLAGKRLELLQETVPKASRVAILWDPKGQGGAGHARETRIAAPALGVELQPVEVRAPEDLENAFQAGVKGRAEALIVVHAGLMQTQRARIVNLAVKTRLPVMYTDSQFALAGGLMSYDADADERYRGVANYVDKILKGTKPADLPVQQPIKFEFIVNLKAAKQIGLTIPPNVLARADRVIK